MSFHIDGVVYDIFCFALARKKPVVLAMPLHREAVATHPLFAKIPCQCRNVGAKASRHCGVQDRVLVEARARACPRQKPSRAWSWPLLSTGTLIGQYIAPLFCCASTFLHVEEYLDSTLQDVKAVHGQCSGQQMICAVRPVE